MNKRYCIFSAQYFPHIGGIERFTYAVAKKLLEAGNEVTIVTSQTEESPLHEMTDENIEIYRFPCFVFLNGRFPVLKLSPTLKKTEEELKNKNFDYIIVNARFYFHTIFATKFACKNKIPAIVIDHGSSHLSVNNKFLDLIGGEVEHFITAIDKHYCKNYYAVSKESCRWLSHFGIEAKEILYNSCDNKRIKKIMEEKPHHFRADLGISSDCKVVVFVGRMVAGKGIIPLIRAFKELNYPNSALILADDGDFFEEAKSYQSSNIIPLGAISFEEVITLLSESDIMCLPSSSEGFCTSVLEAIYCNTLVCSTSVGGTDDVVEDNKSGIIIKSTSEEDITEALLRALEVQNGQAMKDNAFKNVQNFGCTFESTTEKIIEIFEGTGKPHAD